ncbi:MAG TPA: hypothetical protein VFI24_10595 [Pyrinomonadaceae bacterium]|nr:hypothetical protein [Pyrinomonadaceae bacterium]
MKDLPSQINPQSVELHIEELVLHGFAAGDRHAIAAAVERELSRLLMVQFAAHGLPRSFAENSEQARLDAGTFNVAPSANSEAIGGQIAQTVHQGLNFRE